MYIEVFTSGRAVQEGNIIPIADVSEEFILGQDILLLTSSTEF